jgi:hypothetical protein
VAALSDPFELVLDGTVYVGERAVPFVDRGG